MTNLLEKALLTGFGLFILTIFVSLINPFIISISEFNRTSKNDVENYNNFFNALANFISPVGSTLEEGVARKAVAETLEEIFNKFEIEEKGIDELNNLDIKSIEEFLKSYLCNYIYTRLIHILGQQAELSLDENQYIAKEGEVKDYINSVINLDFKRKDMMSFDWKGKEGAEYVDQIFEEGYKILE